jgi:hypothetical protein
VEPLRGGGAVEEVGGGFFDERDFLVPDGTEVDRAVVGSEALDAVRGDPLLLGEDLKADEDGVTGEGGERGVRRAAVANRRRRRTTGATLRGAAHPKHACCPSSLRCGKTALSGEAAGVVMQRFKGS